MRRLVLTASFLLVAAAPAAAQIQTWTTSADFDTGQFTQSSDTPADQVQLGPTPVTLTSLVWVDNYYPGWVLKIDSNTGRQLGRYDSALQFLNGVATGAPPPREYCNWSNQGNCPGRITTDNNGDIWIINRAFGRQGTLSKFSGFNEHCIDRNHNGKIDTSHDANNDGVIDVNNGGEFYGQNDECVLTTIPIGGVNSVPRSVAVDRNGKIWAGSYNTGTAYRFNPAEPVALEASVQVQGCPYSAATGGQYVFFSNPCGGGTIRINIDTLQVDYAPCGATYGIVGDPSGKVAYLGSLTQSGIARADFQAKSCIVWPTPNGTYAATLDLDGNIWGGLYPSSAVKFSPNGVLLGTYPINGDSPHGISVDFKGFVWTVNDGTTNVSKLAPKNGAFVGSYSIGGPTNDSYTPYLYSDFTGLQVNRQAPWVYYGTWSGVYDGGTDGIPWASVAYNTEAQGQTPCDQASNRCAKLQLFVRAADDMNLLPTVGFTPVQNGAQLVGIVGHYVQIEADLSGPGYLTPVLSDVTVSGPCGNGVSDACCIRDADCDDKSSCTTDSCPSPGQACKHVARMNCCATDKDCNDMNACTTDKCPMAGGMCTNLAIKGCCNNDVDCSDGNLCTTDSCSGKGGVCSHGPIGGCCNQNPDCDDGNMCTIDLCSGAGGTCSHFAKANCCNVDADCDDMNGCTTDTCQGGVCTHPQVPGCCNSDLECDDGVDCTQDKCSGPGGVCSHPSKMNCCSNASQCSDNDACTSDDCVKGSCTHSPVLRCCNLDKECNDSDSCTTDSCTGPGGTCVHARVANCCNLSSDCDDHDPCTRDTCSGMGGLCMHAPLGNGCCKKDTDCDDQIACTTDRCNGGSSCDHTPLANCFCASDGDCPPGQLCTDHACAPPGLGDGGTAAPNEFATGAGTFGSCSVAPGAPRASRTSALLGLLLAAFALRPRRRRH